MISIQRRRPDVDNYWTELEWSQRPGCHTGQFRLRWQVPLTSGVVSIVSVHIEGGIGQ